MKWAAFIARVVGVLLAGATLARAQTPPDLTPPQTKESADRLSALAFEAMSKHDPAKAEDLLRRQLKLQPNNFVVYYNLACTRAAQRDGPGAAALISQAVEHGFCDLYQLRRDGVLDVIRKEPAYLALVDHWDAVLIARREANLASARELFKDGEYKEIVDERMRVVYRTAFDEGSTKAAIEELNKVAAYAQANLFPDLFDPEKSKNDAWVTIVLPSKLDFAKWAIALYGPQVSTGNSTVGGAYEHDLKRLVSMDLGATLRHEFMHALHNRHITRQGQECPAWMLEGLGSLVEDYDPGPNGEMVPAPSWRTNILKRVEKLGNLPRIEKLAKIPYGPFFNDRPLFNYAAARGEFMFLASEGKLLAFSRAFDATCADDPTGVKAFEQALGETDLKALHTRWRDWVRSLPAVPEEIRSGAASLGLEVDAGSGEGPVVLSFDRRTGAQGLHINDVITAIDGKPVRDMSELVRVLSGYKPGDEVDVSYRRYKLTGTAKIVLAKKP